jgi:hypothetical protein
MGIMSLEIIMFGFGCLAAALNFLPIPDAANFLLIEIVFHLYLAHQEIKDFKKSKGSPMLTREDLQD